MEVEKDVQFDEVAGGHSETASDAPGHAPEGPEQH